jgi:hypothetical protein
VLQEMTSVRSSFVDVSNEMSRSSASYDPTKAATPISTALQQQTLAAFFATYNVLVLGLERRQLLAHHLQVVHRPQRHRVTLLLSVSTAQY